MEVKWMNYNNKKILVVDYTGIKLEREMISLLNLVPPLIKELGDHETILLLADITGCFMTPGFLNASKQIEKELVNNFKTKRAILGVTGAKVILLKAYNMIVVNKLMPFDSREEALNYLTRD